MIACIDVHYFDSYANATAIVVSNWQAETELKTFSFKQTKVGEYQAGQFYQRELEPILGLLAEIDVAIKTYVIDAYCHLSYEQAPGLGSYLFQHLPADSSVVGVAKNRYKDTKHAVEVLRGRSIRPLFVTAIGMDYSSAAKAIEAMHGEFRIPTLLKRVDHLARKG